MAGDLKAEAIERMARVDDPTAFIAGDKYPTTNAIEIRAFLSRERRRKTAINRSRRSLTALLALLKERGLPSPFPQEAADDR